MTITFTLNFNRAIITIENKKNQYLEGLFLNICFSCSFDGQ